MGLFALLSLLSSALASPPAVEWTYVRAEPKAKGTLTVFRRDGTPLVSAKQLCFALGCRVFYQWANHRAIIQNPRAKLGAIVSSVTHVALVDGKVVEFSGDVVSDIKEGYLLPMELA